MADSPSLSLFPPLILLLSVYLSISSPLTRVVTPSSHCLPPQSPLPNLHPLRPHCFTSLHSGFYGYFVLARSHLTAGWWVPPPVIAAIYYRRRSTSHFSDFGKMVFTLDCFTDSPYNTSAAQRTQTRAHSHTKWHDQRGNITSLYYTADLLGAKMLCGVLMPHSGTLWQHFQIILCKNVPHCFLFIAFYSFLCLYLDDFSCWVSIYGNVKELGSPT